MGYLALSVIINTANRPAFDHQSNWEMLFRASGDHPKHLTLDDAREMINAFTFLSHQVRPCLAHVTIRWDKSALFHPRDWLAVQGRLLDKATRWLRRNGIIVAYLWVREIGKRFGPHTHLLIHLPPNHWQGFKTFLGEAGQFDLVADPSGDALHLAGGRFGMRSPMMASGVLRYMLKGLDPDTHVRSDGRVISLPAALGVDDRGEKRQPIAGKRCGVSGTIGATRRASMGWVELHTPEELHAALHPSAG
ncbi:MAG: hypothetical protein JWP57_4683 [Spirosoma sp.]|nr:hypothetical protein [Spirosoma sp.]